jgi:hypothetical protein
MQNTIAELKASIHFATKSSEYDATLINMHQLEKLNEMKHLEKQLTEETTKLNKMQGDARTSGYGPAIYDPQSNPNPSDPLINPSNR